MLLNTRNFQTRQLKINITIKEIITTLYNIKTNLISSSDRMSDAIITSCLRDATVSRGRGGENERGQPNPTSDTILMGSGGEGSPRAAAGGRGREGYTTKSQWTPFLTKDWRDTLRAARITFVRIDFSNDSEFLRKKK